MAKKHLLTSESQVIHLLNTHAKKELTQTEQLEYKIALLERELLKKDAELVRIKKEIELEGGDIKRK